MIFSGLIENENAKVKIENEDANDKDEENESKEKEEDADVLECEASNGQLLVDGRRKVSLPANEDVHATTKLHPCIISLVLHSLYNVPHGNISLAVDCIMYHYSSIRCQAWLLNYSSCCGLPKLYF